MSQTDRQREGSQLCQILESVHLVKSRCELWGGFAWPEPIEA